MNTLAYMIMSRVNHDLESHRRKILLNNIKIATGQLDRALALLTHLELGDHHPDSHPDVVQAKALLSQAIRTLGGYR